MVKQFAFGRRVLVTPTQNRGIKDPNLSAARKEEVSLQALLRKKERTIGKGDAEIPQTTVAYLEKKTG